MELVLGKVRYTYGFDFDDERIIKEWLHAYPHNSKHVLFERDGASINFGSTVRQSTRAEIIKDLLTDNTLFLAVAARLKLDQYKPVGDWFHRPLLFVSPSHTWHHDDEQLAQFIEQSDSNRLRFLEMARNADFGISNITVEHYTDDPRADEEVEALKTEVERLEREMADADQERPNLAKAKERDRARFRMDLLRNRTQRVRLRLTHGGVGFDLHNESQGTQAWLSLLPEVITSLGSGHTLVIDEIETSLHPLLVRKLVGLFNNQAVNKNQAQLLFTTHDAFLLEPVAGEPGVERDQVWFVEKCPDGASKLYPITDFDEPEKEHNLARRYLGGTYEAVPILDGFDLHGSHAAAD